MAGWGVEMEVVVRVPLLLPERARSSCMLFHDREGSFSPALGVSFVIFGIAGYFLQCVFIHSIGVCLPKD